MPESESESAFHPLYHLLLHAVISFSSFRLAAFLRLPTFVLHGLHTYILPDSPTASGLRAAIRRPDAPQDQHPRRPRPKGQHRSDDFDESKAQLLRLRLSDSDLPSRLHFPLFRAVFLSAVTALPNLALPLLPPIPFIAAVLAVSHLLFSLVKLSFDRSSSKLAEKQLSLLSGFLDCEIRSGDDRRCPLCAAIFSRLEILTGVLAGDGPAPVEPLRGLLLCSHSDTLLPRHSGKRGCPVLWINPLAEVFSSEIKEFRIWGLVAAAVSLLLLLRPNVQTYLNESVLCWYQRLHSSMVPDMDYARAKIFLHNHYICLGVLQFFAPPMMVLLLLGLSQMKDLCTYLLSFGHLVGSQLTHWCNLYELRIMGGYDHDALALEITVLSAESLKKPSSLLMASRLRPYVMLSSSVTTAEHRTRVDETGERNPTWCDTVRVPVDPTFLHGKEDSDAAVHVSLMSKRALAAPARLGWCRIEPADVIDGLHTPAARRHLSYALRVGSYGGKGQGVIHLEARLVGPMVEMGHEPRRPKSLAPAPEAWWGGPVVVGIPVPAAPSAKVGERGGCCDPRGDLVFWRGY
ncbi:hypothetical protein J5N97_029261 [Dioscorea zingiberensis]|uniref:C2 domain-containing protein n=1 Tax=Dioscorea zingiberensis TaxID=325984 RepID=A0A9D5C0M9_9LILI|nr:hypothetical protein J5N97_029261 [Dioscorea zingiberensis]